MANHSGKNLRTRRVSPLFHRFRSVVRLIARTVAHSLRQPHVRHALNAWTAYPMGRSGVNQGFLLAKYLTCVAEINVDDIVEAMVDHFGLAYGFKSGMASVVEEMKLKKNISLGKILFFPVSYLMTINDFRF